MLSQPQLQSELPFEVIDNRAGNLVLNTTCPSGTFTPTYSYDIEDRLISTNGYTYVYDGNGKRVKKCNPCGTSSGGTLYWPSSVADTVLETDLAGTRKFEYIFFNGRRTARRDGTNPPSYYFSDHLGSADVVTSPAGAIQKESDYYPYGGEVVVSGADPNNYKFTGKERDAESGLDNFGARYDASSLGRFLIPDWADGAVPVPYAKFEDPQSLNLYAYADNNPISHADIDGHDCQTIGQHTWCWNRSEFKSVRDAEDAHEAQHREDNKNKVDQPNWKKEQRGFKAEIPVLQGRLAELDAKEKKGGLTDSEKKEKAQLTEQLQTAQNLTQGPEADRNAQRYYRDNQNFIIRFFIPSPDKEPIKVPKPHPTPPPQRPEHKSDFRPPTCIGCEGPPWSVEKNDDNSIR